MQQAVCYTVTPGTEHPDIGPLQADIANITEILKRSILIEPLNCSSTITSALTAFP